MKTLYFDCSSGIAGNMILGALLNLGVPENYLRKELKKIPLPPYQLIIRKVEKNKMPAAYVEVRAIHESPQPTNLKNILKIINKSKLGKAIKSKAIHIYKNLVAAEARVHQVRAIHESPRHSVHLHEVGATDAIIDIVGALICLKYLGIQEIYASPINVGSGTVKHSHGILPVPAPATAELLKEIPFYSTPTGKEMATPTGVAIITTLAKSFGEIPRMLLIKSGYGAGGHNIPNIPNVLRVILAEKEIQTETDLILQIEANIDDLDPNFYNRAIKNIMRAGALDCSIEPILMKKNRTGIKLSVLCGIEKKESVLKKVFTETTTFGARTYLVKREILKRKFRSVKTKLGKLRVKLGILDNQIMTAAPEFEDYKKLAYKNLLK